MIVEYVDGFSVPGLPKWPQMIVRGTAVTVEQAKEIIRRTDRSFTGTLSGNDHATNRVIVKKIGMPAGTFYDPRDRAPNYDWDAVETFRTAWGAIYTEYVTNDWIACSFIGGPHGWCHPDGTVFFSDNVGKYPGVEDVARDWAAILSEFPFLDLTATLMREVDPRLLTLAQSCHLFLDGPEMFPTALGQKLQRYGRLAGVAERDDEEEAVVQRLYRELADAGVEVWEPVRREKT